MVQMNQLLPKFFLSNFNEQLLTNALISKTLLYQFLRKIYFKEMQWQQMLPLGSNIIKTFKNCPPHASHIQTLQCISEITNTLLTQIPEV